MNEVSNENEEKCKTSLDERGGGGGGGERGGGGGGGGGGGLNITTPQPHPEIRDCCMVSNGGG